MIEEQVIEWVEQIAQLFGQLAPEAWRILVTQSYVAGAQKLVTAIISLIVVWRIGAGIKWALENDESNDGEFAGPVVMFGGIFWLAGAVIASVNVVEALGYLINPEYYALMDIISPLVR